MGFRLDIGRVCLILCSSSSRQERRLEMIRLCSLEFGIVRFLIMGVCEGFLDLATNANILCEYFILNWREVKQ